MASNLSPSIDAQALFKELGAVVSDIQATGDLGIKKWSQVEGRAEVEELTQTSDKIAARRKTAWTLGFSVMAIGVIIVGESIWFADMSAKRQAALEVFDEVTHAKNSIASLSTAQQFVPKLLAAAESEASMGQQLFDNRKFVDARMHWRLATTNYQNIPPLVKPLERAEGLQRQFKGDLRKVFDAEYITGLDSKMNQYSQLEWSQIKVITNRAEGFRINEQGEESLNEWTKASELLPSALQKLKVGVWMEQAEQEYKNKGWTRVIAITAKVLTETPDNPRAIQLRDKSQEARSVNQSP